MRADHRTYGKLIVLPATLSMVIGKMESISLQRATLTFQEDSVSKLGFFISYNPFLI